ncbi:MAG: hypothetical protein HS117_26610 [Verrucomicrobiaceae bacterium]|jgi:hypothetical protein|nr:hypothetical protein [Verrucomicrobiaceae bacterium]
MTRHAAFLLFCLFPLLHARAQKVAEKAEKTAKEAPGTVPAETMRVLAFSITDGEAVVVLGDAGGLKLIPLTLLPDAKGRKLLSASVDAETHELRVRAFIEGKEQHFAQPLKTMPKLPADALKAASSETTAAPRKSGPSDDDRKKYESLSEAAKERFRDGMRVLFSNETFRNAPEEERRSRIRALFDEIQKEDQASRPKP